MIDNCLRILLMDGNFKMRPYEMTVEDKKEYMRSFLGNRPFTKEFLVFDNAVIRFTSLTGNEINRLKSYSIVFQDDPVLLQFVNLIYHTSPSLFDLSKDIKSVDCSNEIVELLKDAFNKQSTERLEAMTLLYNSFLSLITELRESLFDQDFWKGAGVA